MVSNFQSPTFIFTNFSMMVLGFFFAFTLRKLIVSLVLLLVLELSFFSPL